MLSAGGSQMAPCTVRRWRQRTSCLIVAMYWAAWLRRLTLHGLSVIRDEAKLLFHKLVGEQLQAGGVVAGWAMAMNADGRDLRCSWVGRRSCCVRTS